MGAVGDVIGGVSDTLFGGSPEVVQGKAFSPMSAQENERLKSIEKQIGDLYGQQGQQDSSVGLFRQQLSQFLAGGSSNPNPTPEQLKQATTIVDQTFTAPAQQQLQQNQADFASQQQAQAAALGRNPNSDIATQQAIMSATARAGQGLQSERGARIQQAALGLNDAGYSRGLQSLNAGMQGSSFLNNLGQQAFANRMGLLNARSGLAGIYQNERSQSTAGVQSSPGILGTVGGAIGQVAGIGSGLNSLSSAFGGGGGNSQSIGQPIQSGGFNNFINSNKFNL